MSADQSTPPALVDEIFSTERDWLVDIVRLKPWGVLRIHPRGRLNVKTIMEALAAQKLLRDAKGAFRYFMVDHGSVILLQRKDN